MNTVFRDFDGNLVMSDGRAFPWPERDLEPTERQMAYIRALESRYPARFQAALADLFEETDGDIEIDRDQASDLITRLQAATSDGV